MNRFLLSIALTASLICNGTLAMPLQAADGPSEILLFPKGAPGAVGEQPEDKPSITPYLPAKGTANGAAVVICPGGGYGHLAMDHEGKQVAQWMNSLGVTAFVLKYRLAPRYHHPAPSQDALRAIRTVRARAKEWNVDVKRIGILGFSAGGHLASTVATHFDDGNAKSEDAVEKAGSRPDFAILGYPVITMSDPFTHGGSRKNLFGEKPDPALVEQYCNEKQVTKHTPPTFLMHTTEDTAVPPENSILFYSALRKAGVPAELHIYEKGQHGLGLAQKDPVVSTWPARCEDWLRVRGVIPAKK